MQVRIIKEPDIRNSDLDGFDLRYFMVGGVYDVGFRLGNYLIVAGFAVLEMRLEERSTAADRWRKSAK